MHISNRFHFMKSAILAAITVLLLAACSNFETINTDPSRSGETQPEFLLASAQKMATDLMYHTYYNARMGMALSQYWMGTDKTTDARYSFTDQGLWSGIYSGPLMDLQEISNYYQRHPDENNPHQVAVAEVMKSWLFHVLTDVYGDIPYTQALQGDEYPLPVFDGGKEVYLAILDNLERQIAALRDPGSGVIRGDIIARGDVQQWIRIANALRIRIALRMSDVLPAEAAAVIAEAATQTLTSVSQDAYFPYRSAVATERFPYNDVERPLVEFAVTTTLVDYMKALGDPRLEEYARPDQTNGQYIGKPYGFQDDLPTVIGLSRPGVKAYAGDAKGYIITYSEIAFALAEAAERGIAVGNTAEEWYAAGIKASLQQWGVTNEAEVAAYLAKVPYDAGTWQNTIGTQKWLALYLQGLQGWLERLRLDPVKPDGTPLFIAPVSGSLDPAVTVVPTRIVYPAATRSGNAVNSEQAAANIGGDTQAVKNWWDVK